MGAFSIWHWLVLLIVILLVFGTGRLRNLGSDLGAAIRGFKKSMQEDEDLDKPKPPPVADATTKPDHPDERR